MPNQLHSVMAFTYTPAPARTRTIAKYFEPGRDHPLRAAWLDDEPSLSGRIGGRDVLLADPYLMLRVHPDVARKLAWCAPLFDPEAGNRSWIYWPGEGTRPDLDARVVGLWRLLRESPARLPLGLTRIFLELGDRDCRLLRLRDGARVRVPRKQLDLLSPHYYRLYELRYDLMTEQDAVRVALPAGGAPLFYVMPYGTYDRSGVDADHPLGHRVYEDPPEVVEPEGQQDDYMRGLDPEAERARRTQAVVERLAPAALAGLGHEPA